MSRKWNFLLVCAVTIVCMLFSAVRVAAAAFQDTDCFRKNYRIDGPIEVNDKTIGYLGSTPEYGDWCTGIFDVSQVLYKDGIVYTHGQPLWAAQVPNSGIVGHILIVHDTILHVIAWRETGEIHYAWGMLGRFHDDTIVS